MKLKLLLAYVFEFLRDGFYLSLFLLIPFITKDIHLSLFEAGSLQTVVNLLIMVLALPTVSLLIKFGEVRILLFSILLYALGFVGFFFSHSYLVLVIIFSIMGVSFAFYATIASYIRTTWFDSLTRGKQLGNLMAIGDIAKVIFSLGIGMLASAIGWRFASLSLGILAGIVFWLCSVAFLRGVSQAKDTQKTANNVSPVKYSYFLKQKKLMLTILTSSLDQGVNAPLYAFLPLLFVYKKLPLTFIGEYAAFYYIGNTISRLIFGRVVDRIGNAKTLILLEISMAVMTFLIATSSSVIFVGVLAFTLGLITEGTDPATDAMVAQALEHVEYPQKASGIRTIADGISKSLFPLLLGLLPNQLGLIWGFYALATASLLPIIPAWIFLKEK